jgi:hypothetical protein
MRCNCVSVAPWPRAGANMMRHDFISPCNSEAGFVGMTTKILEWVYAHHDPDAQERQRMSDNRCRGTVIHKINVRHQVDLFTLRSRSWIGTEAAKAPSERAVSLLRHCSVWSNSFIRQSSSFIRQSFSTKRKSNIEHGSDLHALLNKGHCTGGTVLRVLGDKQALREFSVFAANGRLPDGLEQRA